MALDQGTVLSVNVGGRPSVIEEGQWHTTQAGSPQGSGDQPVKLANIYLHVLESDLEQRRPCFDWGG